MNQTFKAVCGAVMGLLLMAGCAATNPVSVDGEKLQVVATTTMLADLARELGGDRVQVNGLMGPGIDPHLYQASAGDVQVMQNADIVVYNGLHLEGKMGELFEKLEGQGRSVICIETGLDHSQLLAWEGDGAINDPHIWFDVSLWQQAAKTVAAGLAQHDADGAEIYQANLKSYLTELDLADTYIRNRAAELAPEQRVLITAHDAFQYFGRAYGFEVRGLQGISTDAEAGTADVRALAEFITERQIKAVFVETSVPIKTILSLQDAVKARGFAVAIGGELYSDSLGDANSGAESYILTVKANIDTIVDALK